MKKEKLSFGTRGNAKLAAGIATFSLPSGYTCPGARACLAKFDKLTNKIKDGPHMEFRCFSATMEARRPSVSQSRWYNLEMLKKAKTKEGMRDLIVDSMPKNDIVRIHIGGDFFNQAYFDAWLEAIEQFPGKRFYAYTKSLDLWVNRLVDIPFNLSLTASRGGKYDHLIDTYGLKSVVVVFHPEEAEAMGLEVDHDDEHAMAATGDFALLLHGQQPPGSVASSALKRMRQSGIDYSYGATKPEAADPRVSVHTASELA